MKKNITLAVFLLSAVITGFAKQAEQSVIHKVAVSFYFEHARLTEGFTWNSVGIREITPTIYNGRTVYYTIAMNPRGWIVIAADDAVTPVLAYSFEDNLGSSLPPQFISWMHKYQKEIDDALNRNLPPSAGITDKWVKYANYDQTQPLELQTASGIAPLILHNWDQGFPYNIYCPQDAAGPGNHPYAGCVATAMCQVMYYYRFPMNGNGEHCYTPSGYPRQCANYGTTAYDWNSMVNSLTGAKLANDSAVALLLWHAGISVNMMYSAGGSGAYSEDARNAMVNNFRFSPNAWYIHRDDFPVLAWDSIVRANLDRKMPVYYDGYGPQGGHAFNCDGYQGTDHFHFNWGWSGTANGYYYLDNLNPSGDNFSEGEGAIVNLFPDTIANTYPYTCQTQILLKSVNGTFDDGSGPALNYKSNSQCSWLLAPQSSEDSVQKITLTFNSFNTVAANGILRIYKGSNATDSLVAELSGDALPPLITINGPKTFITFTSGSSGQGPGWLISYTGKVLDWCKDAQNLSDSTGVITDGSSHFNYHNSSTCRWRIVPAVNTSPLSLTFTSFRTQKDKDFVQIYDNGTGEALAEYSGIYTGTDLPPTVTAKSGQMFIIFSTDQTGTEAGWEARYSTALGICETDYSSGIQIYPNPASSYLYVKTLSDSKSQLKLELSDINGRTILNQKISEGVNPATINITGVPGGLYFLKIVSENRSVVKKVVIE